MPETTKQWVGEVVAGKFPLLRYLGGSGRSAVFLTERHDGEQVVKAVIKLVPSLPESDELQLARWRLGAELSHPNLIAIFEMGRCELAEAALLYVVMGCAEENLADVLAGRALTPDEAREMLEPVLKALSYLHGKGLVHGHLRPAKIMADENHLRISSDGLCAAGESNGLPRTPNDYDPPENTRGIIPMTAVASPAGDIWSLGIVLVEVLTQRVPAIPPAGLGEVPLPPDLPQPYLDIARHCLARHPEGRWTAGDIDARLHGRVEAPAARPAAAAVVARTPPRQQRVTARSRVQFPFHTKRRGYAIPAVVALGVLAIVVGPRLLRHGAASPAIASPAAVSPPSEPRAAQAQPEQQSDATAAAVRSLGKISTGGNAEKTADAGRNAPVPASVRADATVPVRADAEAEARGNASANPVSNAPAGAVVRGEVKERVLPDVSQRAQDSIRGTVKVSVSVDVDSSGSVENAKLASRSPSKYFARVSLEAAQRWKFQPPTVAGRNSISRWNLQFDFTRDGTSVTPSQDVP